MQLLQLQARQVLLVALPLSKLLRLLCRVPALMRLRSKLLLLQRNKLLLPPTRQRKVKRLLLPLHLRRVQGVVQLTYHANK